MFMKQCSIYKTTSSLLMRTVCLLIEKCYSNDLRILTLINDAEMLEQLNKTLWTYSQKYFIPHGSKFDPLPEKQPVYLTDELQNLNNADTLIAINPLQTYTNQICDFDKLSKPQFIRICIVYDEDMDVKTIDQMNTALHKADYAITSYIQNINGNWEKQFTTPNC